MTINYNGGILQMEKDEDGYYWKVTMATRSAHRVDLFPHQNMNKKLWKAIYAFFKSQCRG